MAEDVRKAIQEVNIKESEGFRRGDAAAVAALYAEDGILLPPNSHMVSGRQEIQKFWKAAMEMGVKDAILTTVELSGSGDTVHELGNYVLKIQPKGKELFEDRGKYIVIWKRTADGWRLHRDIWNTNLPAHQ